MEWGCEDGLVWKKSGAGVDVTMSLYVGPLDSVLKTKEKEINIIKN